MKEMHITLVQAVLKLLGCSVVPQPEQEVAATAAVPSWLLRHGAGAGAAGSPMLRDTRVTAAGPSGSPWSRTAWVQVPRAGRGAAACPGCAVMAQGSPPISYITTGFALDRGVLPTL